MHEVLLGATWSAAQHFINNRLTPLLCKLIQTTLAIIEVSKVHFRYGKTKDSKVHLAANMIVKVHLTLNQKLARVQWSMLLMILLLIQLVRSELGAKCYIHSFNLWFAPSTVYPIFSPYEFCIPILFNLCKTYPF